MKLLYNSIKEVPKNIGKNIIIHNKDSSFNQLYEIIPPYLITFENSRPHERIMQFSFITPISTSEIVAEFSEHEINMPLHSHNMIEFVFVLSGNMVHRINDYTHIYTAGECCLMNKNIRHSEDFSSDFSALFIDLSEDCIRKIINSDYYFTESGKKIKNKRFFYELINHNKDLDLSTKPSYVHFKPVTSISHIENEIYPILNSILCETMLRNHGFINLTIGLFIRLFDKLEDNNLYENNSVIDEASAQDELFRNISSLLEYHHGKMSRKDLESKLNYNSEYINRVIKKYTGMNFTNYSRIFLLDEAKRLLESSDIKISQIVDNLGFNNRNYFNKLFKDKYGVSPNEYRNINLEKNERRTMFLDYIPERIINIKNFSWEDLIL